MTTTETILGIIDVVLIFLLAAAAWACRYWKTVADGRKKALEELTKLAIDDLLDADRFFKEIVGNDRNTPGDIRGLVYQGTPHEYERMQRILRAEDREAATAFINEVPSRRNIRKAMMYGLMYGAKPPQKGLH